MPRFGCPECQSENVAEINMVEVLLPVINWDKDGQPRDFGKWETVDDTVGTKQEYEGNAMYWPEEHRYICRNCDHEFDIPKRLKSK